MDFYDAVAKPLEKQVKWINVLTFRLWLEKTNKSIAEIRKPLKEYEAAGRIDTLTKAAEWVEEEFFQRLHPLELISNLGHKDHILFYSI